MYKKQSQNEQRLARTGSFSTMPNANGTNGLNWELDETLSPQEQLVSCRRALTDINERLAQKNRDIRTAVSKGMCKILRQEKEVLVLRAQELHAALRPLRALAPRRADNLSAFIADVTRETVGKVQWDIIVKEAQKRFDAAKEKDDNASPDPS